MADDAGDVRAAGHFGKPTPARMYDYFLGGKDNFEVDRAAADQIIARLGVEKSRFVAWENRRFLWRAVEYLSGECGVRQFIDVGAGLPTMRNTHEIAQAANPDARVVYVDNDPIVLSHGRVLLAKHGGTAIVTADMREPAAILDAPETRDLIDFSKPVGILFNRGFPLRAIGGPSPVCARSRGPRRDHGRVQGPRHDRLVRRRHP